MATEVMYHVSRITSEHSDWIRSLDFYKQELGILKNRLSEVSIRYTRPEVKAEVEHYQNQFIIQINNIDELRHSIKEHENHIDADTKEFGDHLANHTLAEHDERREDFVSLEKTINDLRHDFNRFLARYM